MPTKPPIWLVTLPWTQEKVINTRSGDHKENSEPQLQWNNPEGRRDVPGFATCVTQARKSLPLPLGRHIYTPPIPRLTVHYLFLWENSRIRLSGPSSADHLFAVIGFRQAEW